VKRGFSGAKIKSTMDYRRQFVSVKRVGLQLRIHKSWQIRLETEKELAIRQSFIHCVTESALNRQVFRKKQSVVFG